MSWTLLQSYTLFIGLSVGWLFGCLVFRSFFRSFVLSVNQV